MQSRPIFQDFRDAWILHEDDAVIAINKPYGVASQAASAEQPDDIVTRLRAFLCRRDGEAEPYLGVHQRLDRDASGVMLFSRDRQANPTLAREFEGRRVDKRYVIAVAGWPGGERTLVDHLAPGRGGLAMVVEGRDPRARKAISHVRCLRRCAERALLEVRIETGRTHQIRAQLAHAGAAVAGDRLYGGPLAPRLLLHAVSIDLAHPTGAGRLRVGAPLPEVFDAWLNKGGAWLPTQQASLGAVLERAGQARWALSQQHAGPEKTTAFRLLHGEGDGCPGLFVDVYGDHLVAHLAADEAVQRRDIIVAALADLGFSGVYEKIHPRQKNELSKGGLADLSPEHASWGQDAPEDLVIHEWGVPYAVRLGDGLRTGIFLDQRDNRRRVRDLAEGATVLNLFAYTCAFSIAAAAGGARETVSVDASKKALERGRQGFAIAGCEGKHRIIRDDAFEVLRRLGERAKERFELVIVDPPTYSKTRRWRWKSGRDWQRLAAMAMAVTARGGSLLLSSNDERMSAQRFRRHVHDGARQAGVVVAQMKDLRPPADYPPSQSGDPHLKSVLVRLGD